MTKDYPRWLLPKPVKRKVEIPELGEYLRKSLERNKKNTKK